MVGRLEVGVVGLAVSTGVVFEVKRLGKHGGCSVSYSLSLSHSVCSPFFVLSLVRSDTLIFHGQTQEYSVVLCPCDRRRHVNKHSHLHTKHSYCLMLFATRLAQDARVQRGLCDECGHLRDWLTCDDSNE